MKIVAIGDPHGNLDKIRKIPLDSADLILLTGDLGQTDILRKQALQYLSIPNPGPQKKNPMLKGSGKHSCRHMRPLSRWPATWPGAARYLSCVETQTCRTTIPGNFREPSA